MICEIVKWLVKLNPTDVVVGFLGVIGVIITITGSKYVSTRIELRAKSRIEWIQKVRNETAELIGLYYSLSMLNHQIVTEMNSETKDEGQVVKWEKEAKEILLTVRMQTELLCLYFGDDLHEDIHGTDMDFDIAIKEENLGKTENNKGKNIYLTSLLEIMCNECEHYFQEKDYDINYATNFKVKISTLRSRISLYLKLEWERAKKGK